MVHQDSFQVLEGFEILVRKEKKITAEIVERLKEIGAGKLYLDRGYTSLFAYLTKGLGYAPASAMRRIETARLLEVVPSVKEDLQEGKLNLSQISILAQGFRERSVSIEEKLALVEEVRGKEVVATQVLVAKALDLPLRAEEKTKHQKDESVRLEITLTKEEMEVLSKAKEVLSHKHPRLSWKELFVLAAGEIAKKRNFRSEAAAQKPTSKAAVRRTVFQRQQECQWVHPANGKKCGSRFQLQIDHIQPKWAGGGDETENVQLLCSVHNKLKYERCG